MRVDEDVVVVRWPQTVQPIFLYMNESRRVEDEDVAVDRDTGATISVGTFLHLQWLT